MESTRAWAEVDLDAFAHNLQAVRRRVGPSCALMVVAKADAYGHGAVAIGRQALRAGADAICLASAPEALELLEAGIRARLVILGAVWGSETRQAAAAGVELGISSLEILEEIDRGVRTLTRPARVHLKVDTGMHRLGVAPEQALEALARIQSSPALELAGVMTHFAALDGPTLETDRALRRFELLLARARRENLLSGKDMWIHAANSSTLLAGVEAQYDAVRIGLLAYGMLPSAHFSFPELIPILTVRTRILQVKDTPIGARVGYGGTWEARRPSRIAILPVGYADGLDWRLSNCGQVLVEGHRAPIVGRISMDYTSIDVTDLPNAKRGTRVTLLGRDGDQSIAIEDLARLVGTIPYELCCNLGRRVERVYSGGLAVPPRRPVRLRSTSSEP